LEKYINKKINLFNVKKNDGDIKFDVLPNDYYNFNNFCELDKTSQENLLQGYFKEANKIIEEQQFWKSS
jgi:type II secretory pathway component PulL